MLRTWRALGRIMGEDRRNELFKPWVVHDIRSTVRTHLSALPVAHEVREAVMAHRKQGVQATYGLYENLDEKRRALELWAGAPQGHPRAASIQCHRVVVTPSRVNAMADGLSARHSFEHAVTKIAKNYPLDREKTRKNLHGPEQEERFVADPGEQPIRKFLEERADDPRPEFRWVMPLEAARGRWAWSMKMGKADCGRIVDIMTDGFKWQRAKRGEKGQCFVSPAAWTGL
jgi:hypothetical protein